MKLDTGQMGMVVAAGAHVLGVAGMAGVWLVPSRLWTVVIRHRIGVPLARDWPSIVAAVAVLTALCFSIFIAADTLPRVFRCLWEQWCTATRGGGLFALAIFGASVLLAELIWLSSRIILGRLKAR